MKIPAIKAVMGDQVYYVGVLTFKEVSELVSRVDEELHNSEHLKDLIQRSISSNYLSIKEYILKQPERFFNVLILAVYDDYPDWSQVDLKFEKFETSKFGLLEFPGRHKVFPLDGQHRVEGIKSAIIDEPSIETEEITAIFLAHRNNLSGMQRSRRLFSTLNRYAKPVTMDDIIALDEDDSVAIVTRYLIEDQEDIKLFQDDRLTVSKNKAIPDSDKDSFTSIITLYQCNRELLKQFRRERKKKAPSKERDSLSLENYLKFRPSEDEIERFRDYCISYWSAFSNEISVIKKYLSKVGRNKAIEFRNREKGGGLLFRPVGLLPFVQASIEIKSRGSISYNSVLKRLDKVDFELDHVPWKHVLWSPTENTMIMGTGGIVKLLLLRLYGKDKIRPSENKKLEEKYLARLGVQNVARARQNVLSRIPRLS